MTYLTSFLRGEFWARGTTSEPEHCHLPPKNWWLMSQAHAASIAARRTSADQAPARRPLVPTDRVRAILPPGTAATWNAIAPIVPPGLAAWRAAGSRWQAARGASRGGAGGRRSPYLTRQLTDGPWRPCTHDGMML